MDGTELLWLGLAVTRLGRLGFFEEIRMGILQALGLAPSERDEKLKELVARSYATVRVVGRGTVNIDPREVRQSDEFKQARKQAKAIVGAQ